MDAIVLAGGHPTIEDPLYEIAGGKNKALIKVGGRPMVQWVIDALSNARRVEQIVLVGLQPGTSLQSAKTIEYIPEGMGMLANIKAALEFVRRVRPAGEHVLLASCDIPSITPEIVDWRIGAAEQVNADLDYAVVTREVMEQRFPGSNRSYLRIRSGEYCGGDLNVLRVDLAEREAFWERLIAARKSVFRQASLLGWDLLLLALTRQLTLEDAERKVSTRLKLKGHATVSPYAELAMDADKPAQVELLDRDLSRDTTAK
jgi:molybdopterin-guanine dinucleotide biosynthesis protein A